jgi:hypothetical protein
MAYPTRADDDIEVNVGPEETEIEIEGTLLRRGPDGSILVDFDGGRREAEDGAEEHDANLAEHVDESELARIAEDIIEYVDIDKQSRADWSQRLSRGLEIMGLREVPEDNLPFEGASSASYPLLSEACVQFQARAMEELFPPAGPVKVHEIGKEGSDYAQRRRRVEQHMNWQMTSQDKAYYWETDQMLFYLPLAGSAFRKMYYSPTEGMLKSPFIKAEEVIVPYVATSLEDAPRITHQYYKQHNDVKRAMLVGEFRDVELSQASTVWGEERDEGQTIIDEAEDREPAAHEDDQRRTMLECHIDLEIDGFEHTDETGEPTGIKLPYIVTVDRDSRKVLSIYRNWEEDDELFRKSVWFVHYKYLPGFGFYGYGLLHMIGGLAEAASGTLRAFLDSAAFATMQGGFMPKEAKMKAGEVHLTPGKYEQTDLSADELANAFYTPPFKEPSPAMSQVFQILVDAGRRFASTTESMVGDASNTGPVGTTVALIEQGSKVFSGIHKRLHQAQREELALRYKLNRKYMPEEGYPFAVEGDEYVTYRADYDQNLDIIPVSDPNIFSSTQRIAMAQTALQMADANPDLYDRRAAHKRMLDAIRMPQSEELLPDPDDIEPQDPVTENMKALSQQPIRVFPHQNHAAHLRAHMTFMKHQEFGGEPMVKQMLQGAMVAHMAQHLAYLYQQRMAEAGVPPRDVDLYAEVGEDAAEGLPPEIDHAMSVRAASAADQFLQSAGLYNGQGPPNQQDAEQMKAQAEMQREQQAWEMEQRRKQAQFRMEEQRKAEQFANEQKRKDLEAVAEIEREMEKLRAKNQIEQEQAAFEAQQRAIQNLEQMAQDRRQQAEKREQEAADARQQREQAEREMQQAEQDQQRQEQQATGQGSQGNQS